MPEINYFTLLEKIASKQEQFLVTILYGFNEFLGERVISSFSNHFLESKNDFNFRRYYFDIENLDQWEEVVSIANSSSFFIESRKIIVATIRDENKINLNKTDKILLETYMKKPNPNTIFILYISLNSNKDDFKRIKKLKIDKLIKSLTTPHTYVINLDKISEREVKQYVKDQLKKRNITITSNALEKIIEIKGDSYPQVITQLPKLEIAASENKSLDSEDIEEIITGIEAHSIWDLTDAIEKEDSLKYLQVLKYLFINGINPSLIIGTLITHYNKIYTAKFLLKHKFPINDIGKVLNQPSFLLSKFIQSVKNFSDQRLEKILRIIYKLDYLSKTSGEDSARLSLYNFLFQIKLLARR